MVDLNLPKLGTPLTSSFIAVRTFSLVFCPRTKIAVFSFSTNCGSRFSSARFTRAFFGFLQISTISSS